MWEDNVGLDLLDAIQAEVAKVVVGQTELLEKVIVALLADGHVLLEGAPGLAKTQLVSALGKVTGGRFRRIQLLPDMLPSDVIGTPVYHPHEKAFRLQKGPILETHFLLADEINRTPPKVQAAFLQAMQEREVTIGLDTFALYDPFIVLATQNPIEEEGTYPLPEAQLDRFLFKLQVPYPTADDEMHMLELSALDRRHPLAELQTVCHPADLVRLREHIKDTVYVSEAVKHYLVQLVRATREPEHVPGLQDLRGLIRLGASPRGGTMNLRQASRALAFRRGRTYVLPDDVKTLAPDVLRHRLILDYRAQGAGVDVESVIQMLLDKVEIP